nr:DNA-directed DNA polymerase [Tanacetum cinerariifolium]
KGYDKKGTKSKQNQAQNGKRRKANSQRLIRDESSNPTSSTNTNPKGRNRRGSKQRVENSNLEEHYPPLVTMADQRTMAEFLRAPTEGYAEAIVVPPILADQFELKQSLINMMTTDQFFGIEKDNRHDHIRRSKQPFILEESPIDTMTDQHTMEELLRAPTEGSSKQPFILEESPIDTMTDQHTMEELLRAPTEGYAEAIVVFPILAEKFELKHSLINMMTSDQFFRLEKDNPHDHIRWLNKITSTIKYKDVPNSAIKLILFPFSLAGAARQTTNLRNEISNFQQRFDESFHEAWDRYKDLLRACPHHGFIEFYQLDTFYNALNPANQDSLNADAGGNLLERRTQDVLMIIENKSKFQASPPPAFVKAVEEVCVTCGGAHPYYQCLAANGNPFPELRDKIQGYVLAAAVNYNQGSGSLPSNTVANSKGKLKAITTRSGLVLDGPTIPTPPPFINLEKGERVEETLTDNDLSEYTIKVPHPPVQKYKPSSQRDYVVYQRDPLHLTVILKKLPEKLRDPRKFLISFGFSELKCKAQADLGASINLMPLSVWKKLGLPELISTRMTLEIANRAICTPDGTARDVFVLVGKFTFLANFIIVDYESDPRPCANPTFSSHPELTSPEVKNDIFDSEGGNFLPEKLRDLDSTKDLHPPLHFGNESDLKEIEYLLYHDPIKDIDSSLKDSIHRSNLDDHDNNLVDSMPEMFTDEHAPDYSSPLIFDEYDDDLFEVESKTKNVYDDPFDSKGEKIKESKLLIDELDLPCDFLPSKYDTFISEDYSRVDALPSNNNKDKVFNPGILIQESPFEIITRVVQDKKLATSNASLVIKDIDPPLYELSFFKEIPRSKMLLLLSSENEEKVQTRDSHC